MCLRLTGPNPVRQGRFSEAPALTTCVSAKKFKTLADAGTDHAKEAITRPQNHGAVEKYAAPQMKAPANRVSRRDPVASFIQRNQAILNDVEHEWSCGTEGRDRGQFHL
jgi:hypothetical protein